MSNDSGRGTGKRESNCSDNCAGLVNAAALDQEEEDTGEISVSFVGSYDSISGFSATGSP